MRTISTALSAALLIVAGAGVALADDYPSRPIRVLVPYAAGGPSDTGARFAAEALGRVLSKPVFVENRGGGGGLNATEAYLTSEPDGYTILVGAIGPFTIMPAAKHVSYDVEKDFIPLGTVWRSAQVLAGRRNLGVATVAEFVAHAKAHPGTVTIGSAGVGAVTHLAIELLKREAGIDVIHVPFRSTGESLPSLHRRPDRRAVRRCPDHCTAGAWRGHPRARGRGPAARARPARGTDHGRSRPAGRDRGKLVRLRCVGEDAPAIVKRLQDALAVAQDDPIYQQNLARQGASAGDHGPASFAQLISADAAKWRAIVTAAGIKLD